MSWTRETRCARCRMLVGEMEAESTARVVSGFLTTDQVEALAHIICADHGITPTLEHLAGARRSVADLHAACLTGVMAEAV